jgi:hypothetical protein
MVKLHV